MKKYALAFLLVMIFALALTACGGTRDPLLVGEWAWDEFSPIRLVFEEDGTGERNWQLEEFENLQWVTNNTRLSLRREQHPRDEVRTERWTYTLSNNGQTLTIQSQQRNEGHRIYTYHRVGQDNSFVGEWLFWDAPEFFLSFSANGTGYRNWHMDAPDFRWDTSGGVSLTILDELYYEHWEYVFSNDFNTVTLTGRDEDGTPFIYTYDRVVPEPRLVGEWTFAEAPNFRIVFDANGNGRRNWHSGTAEYAHFTWVTAGGESLAIRDDYEMEGWLYEFEDDGNTLFIMHLATGIVYEYVR
ncbi:MAG: hypothetical protein FWC16_08830 [Defluviitaleaceae bacterium]|nr:hypothetical protein [Defluviitaleaceae bacterium]MCL2275015.1 hypothetical protein [Defluviitaleaceae bacterium]